jgi:hypothetical protein
MTLDYSLAEIRILLGNGLHRELTAHFGSEDWFNMKMSRQIQRKPTHPGEVLREDILPQIGLSVSEMARRLCISGRVCTVFWPKISP